MNILYIDRKKYANMYMMLIAKCNLEIYLGNPKIKYLNVR